MAKQTGAVRLTGTIDGLNFYHDKRHGDIVRRKPGPSGEKVKRDENFANTRRHNNEFGRASNYGSLIRKAFAPLITDCYDGEMYHRLSTRIYELLMLDNESEWGRRDLRVNTLEQFRHFELKGNCLSRQYFEQPIETEMSDGCLDVVTGIHFHKGIRGAAAWSLKSVAATIDFANGKVTRDEQQSTIHEFEKGNFAMSFRHYFDEYAPVFHGMCIVMHEYDPMIDEYKKMTRDNVNAGFIRYVGQ